MHPVVSCNTMAKDMKQNLLEDLLLQELRSLCSAEKQLFKALSKMTRAACHPKLRTMFMARLEESGEQVRRLERMAGLLGKGLDGGRCLGMRQVVEDEARESLLNARARDETYDAVLIAAAREFIAYEVERYELAVILASRLGLDELERLLQQNLKAQKELAARLTRRANSLMNGRRTNASTPRGASAAFQDSCMMA